MLTRQKLVSKVDGMGFLTDCHLLRLVRNDNRENLSAFALVNRNAHCGMKKAWLACCL